MSWETTSGKGASFSEADECVTHQVVDRPLQNHRFLGRYIQRISCCSYAYLVWCVSTVCGRAYVQPQWVIDCVNRCRRLPTAEYAPGSVLPPHLSPFVKEGADDYIPPERQRELREEEEEEEEGALETGEWAQS